MRLQPRAPISTGKTHCRIPHGKTQTLTDRHQQESVASAIVPIKIQSHAWALERAGSPVHHQHVGKKRGHTWGTAPMGHTWVPCTWNRFLIFEQTGPSYVFGFCSDIRTHVVRIYSFNFWNWKIFFNSVSASLTQRWPRIHHPPSLMLRPLCKQPAT